MITRRDFIRGLGAAAVAGVMPKVADLRQGLVAWWPPVGKAAEEETETLHVKFTEAELAYRYTWNPEIGEETLVTGVDWAREGDDCTVYASLTEKGRAALADARREDDEDLF